MIQNMQLKKLYFNFQNIFKFVSDPEWETQIQSCTEYCTNRFYHYLTHVILLCVMTLQDYLFFIPICVCYNINTNMLKVLNDRSFLFRGVQEKREIVYVI